MSSSSGKKKMIVLKTSDEKTVEVEEAIAVQFETLTQMIGEDDGYSVFPLPNVTSNILNKVIQFCNHCADESFQKDLTKELKDDQETLFDLIKAANYLNMKRLLEFTCDIVADMMRGKSPEEIRKIFHIKNDYTTQEEEQVRRENQWAFNSDT